jgi:hypothetical protein
VDSRLIVVARLCHDIGGLLQDRYAIDPELILEVERDPESVKASPDNDRPIISLHVHQSRFFVASGQRSAKEPRGFGSCPTTQGAFGCRSIGPLLEGTAGGSTHPAKVALTSVTIISSKLSSRRHNAIATSLPFSF